MSCPKWCNLAVSLIPSQANNSYSFSEQKIPSTFTSLVQDPQSVELDAADTIPAHSCRPKYLPPLSNDRNPTSGFFSRTDLSSATIIGQVDQKFIACLISHADAGDPMSQEPHHSPAKESAAPEPSTLVFIDQHAADERVRVEGFLKELCLGFLESYNSANNGGGVKLTIMTPPKPVLVTWHELRVLKESIEVQEAFRNWGIRFTTSSAPDPITEDSLTDVDNNGHGQILVESVPEVISDKVMLCYYPIIWPLTQILPEPQLLREGGLDDLVKGFLAQLLTDLPSFSGLSDSNLSQGADKKFLWLKALRYCPRALLDLINSKACRGMRTAHFFPRTS